VEQGGESCPLALQGGNVKTVEFKYLPDRGNFWAYSPNGKTHELAGTYVLASEANERIKVLEDIIKIFVQQEVDYMTLNNLGDPEQQQAIILARAALEVKP
jgi:hypothetical protein